MAGITSTCTWNVSLIPKWDLSLPKNNRQLILHNYRVGQPNKPWLFYGKQIKNENLICLKLIKPWKTIRNHNISLKHLYVFKYKSTGILLLICLCVISWDKHGVPLSSKHNLWQTAHEHSSENQIPNFPQLSMCIDCRHVVICRQIWKLKWYYLQCTHHGLNDGKVCSFCYF